MNAVVQTDTRPLMARSVGEAMEPLLVLFAAYPEPWTDKKPESVERLRDAQVRAYMFGLDKLPGWAIGEAVRDFTSGKVERPARRVGVLPTVEELAKEVRRHVEDEAARQSRARISNRPAAERVPFMERIERKRAEYADRPVLYTDVDNDKWRALSKSGQLPPDARWVASLGTVFGPKR